MRQFHSLIFCGMGMDSGFQIEGLLDRVREAVHLSGGMQQARSDAELVNNEVFAVEIKNVIRDVAAAFGYAIEFTGGLEYPSAIQNMSADSPENKYCVKKYIPSRDEWAKVRSGLTDNYIFNKKEAEEILLKYREAENTPNTSMFYMFPMGIIAEKSPFVQTTTIDVKISLDTTKYSSQQLKETIESAIDYYLEEIGIGERADTDFNYQLDVSVKEPENG